MGAKVSNNASATLATSILSGATSIQLTGGQGALFPQPSGGNYFYGTLIDASNNLEIVKVTARATDVLTVTRGQDGTAARAYNTGDRFELHPVAALSNEKVSNAGTALTSGRVPRANSDGDLTDSANLTFAGATLSIGVAGASLGQVSLAGNGSGTTILQAASVASGTLTLPAVTDILATLAGSETFSNKTFVAPILGTPASGDLSNCTFPTLNQSTTGNAATANGLQSSTTAVSVNASAAPSGGQVLTAINGTTASWQSVAVPTGVVMDFAGTAAPTGWLECDGSAVSRATYASLFAAIGTTWGAGDGSTTFNLPAGAGRVRIGRGTVSVTESGVDAGVDVAGDTLTVASNNTKWITGMPVVFTLSSGTITGLTSGNTYYIVRASSTLVKLALSLANAQNGTVVNITAKSTPVWTITYTGTARTIGEYGGEEAHAMALTELVAHTHTAASNSANSANGAGSFGGATQATSSTGGNNAMNIMQLYGVFMSIIKT